MNPQHEGLEVKIDDADSFFGRLSDRIVDSVGKFMDRYFEGYFRPWPGERQTYERMGIGEFRKAVLVSTGHIHDALNLTKWGMKNYFIKDAINYASVKRFETWTRINESVHLVAEPFFVANCAEHAMHQSHALSIAYGLAALVNPLCIFLQRDTRSRLYPILRRLKRNQKE